jgi:anti-sigma-K factor RskA
MNDVPDQSVEDIALDYVLGFSDAEERRRVEQAMEREGALAQAVHDWQARLAPLMDVTNPAAPPPHVWRTLERRTGMMRIVPRPARWALGVGLAAAACLALLLIGPPDRPASHLALKASDGTLLATADIDRRNVLRLHPVAMPPAPAGKSYELWIIGTGGIPRPDGLMPDDPSTPILLAEVEPGAVLAVSVEPAGGSPTGVPTGPVVASGSITAF